MSPKLLLWHHRCSWFCPSRTSALMDKGFGRLCGGEKGGVQGACLCCRSVLRSVSLSGGRHSQANLELGLVKGRQ